MPIVSVRTDFTIKIKLAIIKQLTEEKKISCIWRRGKRELPTKAGMFDPKNQEAKIDDLLRMNTGLDYDQDEKKF